MAKRTEAMTLRRALLIAKMHVSHASRRAAIQHGHRDPIAVELRQTEAVIRRLAEKYHSQNGGM